MHAFQTSFRQLAAGWPFCKYGVDSTHERRLWTLSFPLLQGTASDKRTPNGAAPLNGVHQPTEQIATPSAVEKHEEPSAKKTPSPVSILFSGRGCNRPTGFACFQPLSSLLVSGFWKLTKSLIQSSQWQIAWLLATSRAGDVWHSGRLTY